MLKIGIIGAGSISQYHIEPYQKTGKCEVKAIADVNIEFAKKKAAQYGIADVYDDYHEILKDESIDAVSIVTPTFTHKQIIIDALNSGKHVLCEKPPALNADEVKETLEAAKKNDKVVLYGFVLRYDVHYKYLKEFIDAGKMGKIMTVEAQRVRRCDKTGGWFVNKKLAGGGALMDGAIHELDTALALMGYPKPKTVVGYASGANNDLPDIVKANNAGWKAADNNAKHVKDVESVASGYVIFENGASLFIKASQALHTVKQGITVEICGEKAGAIIDRSAERKLQMMDTRDNYITEYTPVLAGTNVYQDQVNHFVDCILNGTEPEVKMEDMYILMQVIDAIYKSAETGKPVEF